MQTNQPYTIQISSKLVLYMAFKKHKQAKLSKFGQKKSTRQKKTTLDTGGGRERRREILSEGSTSISMF